MKLFLTLTFTIAICFVGASQNLNDSTLKTQNPTYTYAYITIEGKTLSKKLKVDVDFGDTPEQLNLGKEYSEILTNKKSYAAVLNYMTDKQYEFVESRDNNFSYQGTGGTNGIVFIMRRKIIIQ